MTMQISSAKRLPSCLLAVLPRFRNAIIPLLIEYRRWADACSSVVPVDSVPPMCIQHNGNRMREFSKLGNTASKQLGSLLLKMSEFVCERMLHDSQCLWIK